jgi:hypothetical protein
MFSDFEHIVRGHIKERRENFPLRLQVVPFAGGTFGVQVGTFATRDAAHEFATLLKRIAREEFDAKVRFDKEGK